MVLIAEKKYACEACIKGHRASACQHTDRPLYEIKRKGRPVSQCQHCRELRKTKQVHVKCMCALSSGDTDYASSPACECDRTGECHCCTTRTPYSGRQPKARASRTSHATESGTSSEVLIMGPTDIADAAQVGGHRRLLPKPAASQQHPFARSVQAPLHSSYGSASSQRLQDHSPSHSCCSHAGSHGGPQHAAPSMPQESPVTDTVARASYPYDEPLTSDDDLNTWLTMFDAANCPAPEPAPSWTVDTISLCECSPGCGCAGCSEHGVPAAGSAAGSCAGPQTCTSCLDCALNSVPLASQESDVLGQACVGPELGGVPGGQGPVSFDLQPFSY